MKKLTTYKGRKIALIILGVVAFILIGIHILVTFQSKKIADAIIAQYAEGRYQVKFDKVRFNYFNLSISIIGISIKPSDTLKSPKGYYLESDTVLLRLQNIVPLLFHRQVNIEEFDIINTNFKIKQRVIEIDHHEVQADSAELFSQHLVDIARNILGFMKALEIKSCRIQNADFSYYPFPKSNLHYNLENIYLTVRDLDLEGDNSKIVSGVRFKAKVNLKIIQPNLQYPDSNLSLFLDKLEWDNTSRTVEMNNLAFIQKKPGRPNDSTIIQLSEIRAVHFDWASWVDSGYIRIDTILVNRGMIHLTSLANLNDSDRDNQNVRKSTLLRMFSPMEIKVLGVKSFTARYDHSMKIGAAKDTLMGDSLLIQNLVLDSTKEKSLTVSSLQLAVRKFVNEDRDSTFRGAFASLKIDNDSIILEKYILQTLPNSKFGPDNILVVPAVVLSGVSINDLLNKKLLAKDLTLDHPYVSFSIVQPENKKGEDPSNPKSLIEALRPYIQVDRITIKDADITIKDKAHPGREFGSHKFSAVILSKALLRAYNTEEMFRSLSGMDLDNVFFITPKAQFHLYGGKVDYNGKKLYADKIEGFFRNNQMRAEMYNVKINASDDLEPFNNPKTLKFSSVIWDSAKINYSVKEQEKSKVEGPNNYHIDSLRGGRTQFYLKKGDVVIEATARNVNTNNFENEKGDISWKSISGNFESMKVKTPKIDFSAGETSIMHDALSVSKNVRLQMDGERATIRATIPELKFRDEINGPALKKIVFKQLDMADPKILIQINTLLKNPIQKGKGKDLLIENLTLQRPNLDIIVIDSAGTTTLKSSGKNFHLEEFKLTNLNSGKKNLELSGLNFDLTNLQFDNGRGYTLRTSEIKGEIPKLNKIADAKARIKLNDLKTTESKYISLHGTDTVTVNNNSVQISNLPEISITKKDIIREFLKIPDMQMGKTNFNHHTEKRLIDIVGLNMNARDQYFEMDSFSFINRIPRDSFWLQQPFEKDYFTITSGKVRMYGLKPIVKNNDTVVYARKISFRPLNLKVERDKRRPADTTSYRPLLANSLMKIPFPFEIDSLELKRSMIWHNVIDAKTEKEGTIYFSDLDALIRNIRNYEIKDDDTLRLRADAKLMGKGSLYIRFRQSYRDSLQTFLLAARMGSMEMNDLNSILTPLGNARADKGIIDSMWMEIKGNDYFAFGKMTLDYRQLKIALLKTDEQRRNFVSWIANLVVRTNNSRQGNIYEDRLRNKSIFNYWAKISMKGLLTNLGIVRNKKQLKKYARTLKAKNLPPDLPDE